MTAGQLKPTGSAETIVTGLPDERQHEDKGLTFDERGSLYINVGAPSNACQQPDRRPGVAGQDPCPVLEKHGGVWKFDENKLNQTQDMGGTKFATGLRQFPAITWHDGALYIVMNNRDQLDVFWPEKFTAKDNAERPAEPMYRATMGANFGWPFCFYDYGQKKFVLNPEYGGDGNEVGRCAEFTPPVAVFPAHWAPVDVMFYSRQSVPEEVPRRRVHRIPRVVEPVADAAGRLQRDVPAVLRRQAVRRSSRSSRTGFAGKDPLMNPSDAVARADGVAQAPDGSLYIADSQKGKIWRVMYKGAK